MLTLALLPGMIGANQGRIVNISSGIAAHPETMAGMNAYATSKAALEAHTLNLAAELAGTGVTANIFRPGSVDTAMQADGTLITAETSARALLDHLSGEGTGEIWEVPRPR